MRSNILQMGIGAIVTNATDMLGNAPVSGYVWNYTNGILGDGPRVMVVQSVMCGKAQSPIPCVMDDYGNLRVVQ